MAKLDVDTRRFVTQMWCICTVTVNISVYESASVVSGSRLIHTHTVGASVSVCVCVLCVQREFVCSLCISSTYEMVAAMRVKMHFYIFPWKTVVSVTGIKPIIYKLNKNVFFFI